MKIILLFYIFFFTFTPFNILAEKIKPDKGIAVVDTKFLFFTHPKLTKFDFVNKSFPSIFEKLNKYKEEIIRAESTYKALLEKKAIFQGKLEKFLKSKKFDKKQYKKIENTILLLNKKLKSVKRMIDVRKSSLKNTSADNLWNKHNIDLFKSIQKEVIEESNKYAKNNGFGIVIDKSRWVKKLYSNHTLLKNIVNKSYSGNHFHNDYEDYLLNGDYEKLEPWLNKGVNVSLNNFSDSKKFILYGGKDISLMIYRILQQKYIKGDLK
ncbi:hypothetical protein KAJ27_02700 [bacterium]|nr:hypothetical protein [bacterium]